MSLKYRDREFTDAETAYREICDNASGGFQYFFRSARRDIIPILDSWISSIPDGDPVVWERRRQMGQSRHMLVFQDYTNMARAVFGEFLAAENLEENENPLAAKTVRSNYIANHLDGLLVKIRKRIEQEGPASNLYKLLEQSNPPVSGPYQPLYKSNNIPTTIAMVLANPEKYDFNDKIVTLHDVMDFMKKLKLMNVPAERCMGTFFKINDAGQREYSRQPIKETSDFRFNDKDENKVNLHYTLKENSGYIKAARINGTPIWAGPSFTTARLMFMSEWAGASLEEKKAMAWGIFAFWNQCYPHSSTWIHRYNSVMDMAANFGVYYWPFNYAKDIPPNDEQ